MRTLLVLIVVLCLAKYSYGMTKAQIKKTLTIMKKQCVPKIGVAEDKIDKIEQGVFIEDPKVMCYITCVYKTLGVMRNNKVNKELVSKQVDTLYPPEIREDVKKGIYQCMPIQDNYEDSCQGVFYAAKCLYEYNPENFVFP